MASKRALGTQKKSVKKHDKRRHKISSILRDLDYKKIYEESTSLQRTINNKGIIIGCNDAYAKALGYTKKEIVGKPIFSHVAIPSLGSMRKSFQIWKKNGFVDNQEVLLQRKDGTTFPVLLSASSIYDKKGTMIGSNTSIKDISEINEARIKIKESEQQLREQYEKLKKINKLQEAAEQKYRSLYQKSPVLLRTIDFDGRIMDCNDAYVQTLGYTKEEAISMSLYDHTAEKSLKDMSEEFEEWKKTREISQIEIWLKRKDESTFPCLLSGDTLYDDHGTAIGRTVALTDLTEIYDTKAKLEASEKRLREQYDQLKKLNTLKDDFLTMITHELKTPLVPIKAFIDILMSEKLGTLNSEQQKRLEIIKSSTNSLLKLVSDLLDAQKLELGLLKMNKDVHDLSEIIELAVNKMKPNAEKKGIVIATHLQESLPFICDNSRMEQVISNLINNSLDFCLSQDSKIDIILRNEGDNIKIVVKDNGIGITKEDLDNVFVKFYQRDTSVTREHGGTGIGLSVCKGIVEAHGGKIWVESGGKNKGTEIHIMFPIFK
ncbi:MAG: PAS domain-containing sensor histidine kinase [Nitrosotalea sp.]